MYKCSNAVRLLISALATAMSLQVFAAAPEKTDPASSVQPLETTITGFMPLTFALGMMGSEIIDHSAKTASAIDDERESSFVPLAYAEIDSLASGLFPETLDAINASVDRGLPVLLESSSWDVAGLRTFVHSMFPTADTSEIENTAVLIWKTKDQITVKNADHTQAQMLAGIPFNQTMEGKLAASTALAKATRIHWTVKFAEKAFEATPTDGDYNLVWNNDVVDVWSKKTAPKDKCVVAWRGSNSLGDWLRNLQSQVFEPMAIDGIPVGAGKGASGFVTRLHNLDNDIRSKLSASGCKNIIVTGHSLGAAMAQLFTLQLLHNTNFNVTDLRAYNPPRTGDETAQATFQNKQSQLESGYGIYCRNGDPVGPIPLGFVRFGPTTPGEYACTMWAPRVAWFNLPANHDLALW